MSESINLENTEENTTIGNGSQANSSSEKFVCKWALS